MTDKIEKISVTTTGELIVFSKLGTVIHFTKEDLKEIKKEFDKLK